MKFLADMGISLRTVDWLRDKGHDVVHLRDEGLQRLPDDEILEKAKVDRLCVLVVRTGWEHPNHENSIGKLTRYRAITTFTSFSDTQ
jgi:hypothetical protein